MNKQFGGVLNTMDEKYLYELLESTESGDNELKIAELLKRSNNDINASVANQISLQPRIPNNNNDNNNKTLVNELLNQQDKQLQNQEALKKQLKKQEALNKNLQNQNRNNIPLGLLLLHNHIYQQDNQKNLQLEKQKQQLLHDQQLLQLQNRQLLQPNNMAYGLDYSTITNTKSKKNRRGSNNRRRSNNRRGSNNRRRSNNRRSSNNRKRSNNRRRK
tara:strand:+ start:555 stop:1205 length:651 start_codon:yes stop_codon:yes gene_type:complete